MFQPTLMRSETLELKLRAQDVSGTVSNDRVVRMSTRERVNFVAERKRGDDLKRPAFVACVWLSR